MSVLKTVGLSVFILFGIFLASWAGAPRTVIRPVQIISPSSIPVDADGSKLPPGEGNAQPE